jgi:hypothetical protein
MKKFFIGIVAVMAIFALVAPAPAIMKITSQGYYKVSGIYISNNPIDNHSDSNDWYNMEMIVEPVLHINDKVRIHSQISILERNYTSADRDATAGNLYATDAAQSKYNVFGDEQNNFWVQRLYMAAEVMGGFLTVGRMSGGAFGYAWGDSESNADRIKYVRRFGMVTLVGVYEKSRELDGGQQAPRLGNLATDPSWDASDNDTDSYGLAAVVPLGKMGLLRFLSWNIRDGNPKGKRGITDSDPNWGHLLWLCTGLNLGTLKIDTEINYSYREDKSVLLPNGKKKDVTNTQWSFWGEVGVTPGPFEVYGGGFYIQGEDSQDVNNDDRVAGYWSVGRNFEPTLLLFSEDMGLLYGIQGLANGSIGNSGIWEIHARAGYKLTDTMKLTGILQYVSLAEMEINNVDKEVGYEFDMGFEWKFMPNVTYMIEGAYFSPGDYFKDTFPDDQSVYGVRNTIRVEW